MKKITALFLAFVISLCPVLSFADELVGEIVKQSNGYFILELTIVPGPKIIVDGVEKNYNPSPYIENDRTYVPVRALLEDLGFVVDYDDPTETIIARNEQTSNYLAMQIGSKTYSYNGETFEFDTAPHIKQDRTFVPIRIIYEMLGYDVSYDAATHTAIVTSK